MTIRTTVGEVTFNRSFKRPDKDNARPSTRIEDGHGLAQAIVDTIRDPLLVLDRDLTVVKASRSFFTTFMTEPKDVYGRSIFALGDGEWNIPELRHLLEEILPRHKVMDGYEIEHEFRGIGRRAMLLNAREVFDESNGQKLILVGIVDVTDQRAAEHEMAELLKQREILVQEMQHRIGNSLQIIASILSLKARTVQSEEIRMHLNDAHHRVMSVAAVQQQLRGSMYGEQIEVGPYLQRLCEALAASMIGDSRPIVLQVQANTGGVLSNEAVSIGLIVTELVINAIKHAFVSDRTAGRILVAYEVADTGWRLTISDDGVGAMDSQPNPAGAGLGTSIVEALAKQLDGSLKTTKTARGRTISITHGSFVSLPPTATES